MDMLVDNRQMLMAMILKELLDRGQDRMVHNLLKRTHHLSDDGDIIEWIVSRLDK